MTRRLVLLLLPAALATVLLVAAWDRAREPGPGEARLLVDGEALVVRADGAKETVGRLALLRRGDRVTVSEGRAWLDLAGDTVMAARSASDRSPATSLRMDRVPTLFAGDLLVEADAPLTVDTGTATVDLDAATAHLRRSYTTTVGVYAGAAGLTTAGRELAVPALREAHVSAPGRLPTRARPLHYDADDEWDRRFLARAMALGEQLRTRASTYTATLEPGEGRTPGFYQLLLPQLEDEPQFGAGLISGARSPGETLVGAAITVLGEEGGFAERWDEVFAFRDEGAAWGLVAMDQGVDADPLRATVEEALALTRYEFGAPAGIASVPVAFAAGLDGAAPGGAGGPGAPGSPGSPGGPTGPGGTGLPVFTGPGATDPAGTGPFTSFPGGPGPGETIPPGGGGTPLPTVTLTVPPVPTVPGGGDDGGPIDDIVDTITTLTLPPFPTTLPPLPTTLPPVPTTRPPIPTTLPPVPTTRPPIPTTLPPLPTTVPPLPTTTTIRLPPIP